MREVREISINVPERIWRDPISGRVRAKRAAFTAHVVAHIDVEKILDILGRKAALAKGRTAAIGSGMVVVKSKTKPPAKVLIQEGESHA